MKLLLRLCILTTFIWLFSSCQPSTAVQDTSCSSSCWFQIVPGVTTKQEVLAILPTIIEVQANSIQDAAILTEGIHTHVYWHFVLSSSDSFGIIEFDDGIVSLISIKPKKGAIRLAEAISLLGEPEKVLAYKETGEMRRLILYILYPSKGYALLYQSGEFRGESKEIEPNHSLERIFLFNPLSYVNIITEGPLEKLNPNLLDKYILPWKGYEEIFPVEKQD